MPACLLVSLVSCSEYGMSHADAEDCGPCGFRRPFVELQTRHVMNIKYIHTYVGFSLELKAALAEVPATLASSRWPQT